MNRAVNLQPTETDEPVEEQPTFDVLPLSDIVRRAVDALGYKHPTPVQRAVFETVASGKDVVVQARTGTGKTAAFGLPVVDRIVDPTERAPQVLILSPTRELALQINRELEKLAQFSDVECTAVYGGAAMQPQVDAIRSGAQVIAGTPGRVLDHLERRTLDPTTLRALVLDESDEMLSMGFLPQITKIMERLPKEHQTLLFSATLPPDVRRIAETRLTDPEFITLSGDHIGALSIEHFVYRSLGQKAEELVQVIEIENPESAIVFCNTRDQTKRISAALSKRGYAADWLNADLSQSDREKVMRATREGKLRFLVCTDVAARGIDISHLTHVINADFPESTENYVHRTGRTGRAGKTGTAISLIAPQDVGNLYMLRLTYKIFPVERDLPRAGEIRTRKETDLVEFLYQAFSDHAILDKDRSLARRILSSDVAETILAGLLRDHLGAHPGADEEAADARRKKSPAPVKDKKRKKEKKKGDKKSGKKHKEAEASDEETRKSDDDTASTRPAETSKEETRASESAVPSPAEPAPKPDREMMGPRRQAVSGPAARKRSQAGAREAVEKARTEAHSASQVEAGSSPASRDETPPAQDMEVVSATDLLSDEEREMLEGVYPENAQDRSGGLPEGRPRSAESRSGTGESTRGPEGPPPVRRIFVSVGDVDEVDEEDFLDTLADNGFPIGEVDSVQVKDKHTLVAVPRELFDQALACLDGEDVGGLVVRAEPARPPKRRFRKR